MKRTTPTPSVHDRQSGHSKGDTKPSDHLGSPLGSNCREVLSQSNSKVVKARETVKRIF